MEINERSDYLSISKEEFLARIDRKIKSVRKDWASAEMHNDNFIEYDKVQLKGDTLFLTKSFHTKQPRGGIAIKIENSPKGIVLRSKIYIDESTGKFFQYFLGSLVLLVSTVIQLWEFSIPGIFLTLLIELIIFIYPAVTNRETLNDLEFYYQKLLRDIENSH
jgi:hypothetical protein